MAARNGATSASGRFIDVAELTFRHAGSSNPALRDVTLGISAGEYVALLGAEGSGRTTLLLALGGVVPQLVPGQVSGSVRVGGRDAAATLVHDLTDLVGLVLDDPGPGVGSTTVAEEVAFGLESLAVPPAQMRLRVPGALASVGLAGFEDRAPATLSGGERQRLALAAVLVMQPQILLLDGPTAGLDPAGRQSLFEMLRNLNRRDGITIVVADEDVDSVAVEAGRAIVLEAGRVVADGPASGVFADAPLLRNAGVRVPGTGTAEADIAESRPQANAPVAVEVQAVSYRYSGAARPAVSEVSLTIRRGEVLGVTGANGSGKTTLGRLVHGLLRPDRGTVVVGGIDTSAVGPADLAVQVGSTFQDPGSMLFARTVAAELELGPRALNRCEADRNRAVAEVVEELQLGALLERHPLRLGPGQRRLVALGAVLTMRPGVLVLDEPTTSADARTEELICAAVERAAGEGAAVLLLSHDARILRRLADRVLVMDGGRL